MKENVTQVFKNTIWNCDCKQLLRLFPDCFIDCILTDPPYKNYRSNRPIVNEKLPEIKSGSFDLDFFATESYRILKYSRHLYCFCDHNTFPSIRKALVEAGFTYKNCLIWVKNNHGAGDLYSNFAPKYEMIIYVTKGQARDFQSNRISNVLMASKVSNYAFNHPTTKPVSLLQDILRVATKEGELVLDTYCGTGSLGEACKSLNRNFVMCDINFSYFMESCKRLTR